MLYCMYTTDWMISFQWIWCFSNLQLASSLSPTSLRCVHNPCTRLLYFVFTMILHHVPLPLSLSLSLSPSFPPSLPPSPPLSPSLPPSLPLPPSPLPPFLPLPLPPSHPQDSSGRYLKSATLSTEDKELYTPTKPISVESQACILHPLPQGGVLVIGSETLACYTAFNQAVDFPLLKVSLCSIYSGAPLEMRCCLMCLHHHHLH